MINLKPSDIRIDTQQITIQKILNDIEEEKFPYPFTKNIRSSSEQSKTIERLFLKIPTSNIFIFNNSSYICNEEFLEDILDFCENNFKLENLEIFKDFNGMFFKDNPFYMQRKILETYITVNTIYIPDTFDTEEIKDYLEKYFK